MILDLFRKDKEFNNIQGYDDIKDIVRRALGAEDNYNLLFIGPPASAKTLFLLGILDIRKNGVYFDGSNTTNRILNVLEEERPKIICIDELDKMPQIFQNQLLNFMESGRVKVDQQRRQYDFEIKGVKIFGSCNEVNRLSKPLQSRFRKLFLPRYKEEKFLDAATKAKPKTETAPVSKPKRVENNNCKICGKYVDWWQNAVQQDTSLLHEKCYNTMGKRNDS